MVDKADSRMHGLAHITKSRGHIEAGLWCVLLSAFVSWYGELFYEAMSMSRSGAYGGILDTTFSWSLATRLVSMFFLALASCFLALRYGRSLLDALYRYRYPLAAGIVFVWTALSLSTSSIGFMASVLHGEESGVVFGIARAIRSDEWLVNTPLFTSQEANGFAPVSATLMGANTTLGYNLPSWSVVALFRPFQWGYLLLGAERGISFATIVAPVACFLISLELAMLFLRGDKWLSALFSSIVTLSPYLLWWLGAHHYIIYGEGLVLGLYHYLYADTRRAKVGCAALIAWLCGCYLFILYPAWMVPYFYIFALMGVCVVVEFVQNIRSNSHARDHAPTLFGVIVLVVFLLAVAGLIALCVRIGWDSIEKVLGTVYPGGRVSTGGDATGALRQFLYGPSLFYAVSEANVPLNASESSAMFAFFPLGIVGSLWLVVRRRCRDLLVILLVILDLLFLGYCFVPIPELVARATLMSYVPANRLLGPAGYIDAVLLVCALRAFESPDMPEKAPMSGESGFSRWASTVAALALSMLFLVIFRSASAGYLRVAFLIPLALVCIGSLYPISRLCVSGDRHYVRLLASFLSMVLLVTGVCVNPIQRGLGVMTDSELWHAVQAVLTRDDAYDGKDDNWVALGSFIIPNICSAAGATTINSTNAVPRLELWHQIDPTGSYEDAYNRYCHVAVTLVEGPTRFDVVASDYISIELAYEDLEKLGIGYVVTDVPSDVSPREGVRFSLVGEGNGYGIYQVSYV